MRFFLHPKPFYIYNIILVILFSLIINPNKDILIIYYTFYCIFHFVLIYLGVYYFNKILYFIYFFYGLGLDILWLNEIGPHLLTFMMILFLFKFYQTNLYSLNSSKIFVFLLLTQISMIIFETFFSYLFFNLSFNLFLVFKLLILSLVLSYPIFLLFSKIDIIK